MGDTPRSLRGFEARFADDLACARWLLAKRWPDGCRCPACGHDHGWELGRGVVLIEGARCHRQTSVTAGTVMHRSHLPLKVWFTAAWLTATHRATHGATPQEWHLGTAAVAATRARLLPERPAAARQAAPRHG